MSNAVCGFMFVVCLCGLNAEILENEPGKDKGAEDYSGTGGELEQPCERVPDKVFYG